MLIDSYFRCLNCYWHEIFRHFFIFFHQRPYFYLISYKLLLDCRYSTLSPLSVKLSKPCFEVRQQSLLINKSSRQGKGRFQKKSRISICLCPNFRWSERRPNGFGQTHSDWLIVDTLWWEPVCITTTDLYTAINPHLGKVEVSGKVQLHAPIVKTISL